MNKRNRNELGLTWVGGCAIGCGIATALLICAGIAIAGFLYYGESAGQGFMSEVLSNDLDDARANEQVSVEEEMVFRESISLIEQRKTGTMGAVFFTQLWEHLQKSQGAKRESVLRATKDLNKFIQTHPKPGMTKLMEFVEKHPVLNKVMDDHGVPDAEHDTSIPPGSPPAMEDETQPSSDSQDQIEKT